MNHLEKLFSILESIEERLKRIEVQLEKLGLKINEEEAS